MPWPRKEPRVLIVVHPGSACGSANFNIGKSAARSAREALVATLDRWTGPVVVIDGTLSDELPDYPRLDRAIKGALKRAEEARLLSARMIGDDPDQVDVVKTLARQKFWSRYGVSCVVTGAWHEPESNGGCVGSVVQALREIGVEAKASDCALVPDWIEEESPEPDSPGAPRPA